MDTETQRFATKVSIVGSLLMQLIALIILGLIILIHDGPSTETVIVGLVVMAGMNTLGGAGVAAAHIWRGLPATVLGGAQVAPPIATQVETAHVANGGQV